MFHELCNNLDHAGGAVVAAVAGGKSSCDQVTELSVYIDRLHEETGSGRVTIR